MEEYKLFDAEYRLMELVWNLEPVRGAGGPLPGEAGVEKVHRL